MSIFNYLYLISVLALIIGCFIVLKFVVPLQIKQAGVKNGLKHLRRLLLIQGFTHLITGLIASYYLGRGAYRILTDGVTISVGNAVILGAFCFGYLVLAISAYKIYHLKYIEEQKS